MSRAYGYRESGGRIAKRPEVGADTHRDGWGRWTLEYAWAIRVRYCPVLMPWGLGMLLKVRTGAFDAQAGDLEPNGEEIWSWDDEELSGATLSSQNQAIELGTWYAVDDFAALLNGVKVDDGVEVLSAISVRQSGVAEDWAAAIEIGESHAALMICRSVIDHARRLAGGKTCWVRVE